MWALDLALAVPAMLILIGWLFVAVVHLDDRYEVGHGQGVWMALAHHANLSGLYPELFDGASYGGTRYMPLPILLHAGLARLTGEYVTSGKLVGLLVTAGLLVATYALLRALGCRWSWALGLTAVVVGGFAGLRAGTTIGGDSLPVLFGVGALGVVLRSRRHPALITAATLVALGISSKLTALWAPLAIATWLLVTERRRAAAFLAYAAVVTAVTLGAFNVLSDGRMAENLLVTSGAGVPGFAGLLKAPLRLLAYLAEGETAVWALLPVLAYAAGANGWRLPVAVIPLAWLMAAGLLVVIYADLGTGPNQLIDLAVITALVTGVVVAYATPDGARDRVTVMVLAAVLVWSGTTALAVRLRPPLQEAVAAVATGAERYPRNVLSEHVPEEAVVLSEDPGLLVELGRTPTVLDPFMLRRLAETHPAAVEELVARIARHEFDLVVLVVELQDTAHPWWRDYHFGTEVIEAVDRAYQFDERVGPYYLYRPRP